MRGDSLLSFKPTPIIENVSEVQQRQREKPARCFLVKWPSACGAECTLLVLNGPRRFLLSLFLYLSAQVHWAATQWKHIIAVGAGTARQHDCCEYTVASHLSWYSAVPLYAEVGWKSIDLKNKMQIGDGPFINSFGSPIETKFSFTREPFHVWYRLHSRTGCAYFGWLN